MHSKVRNSKTFSPVGHPQETTAYNLLIVYYGAWLYLNGQPPSESLTTGGEGVLEGCVCVWCLSHPGLPAPAAARA